MGWNKFDRKGQLAEMLGYEGSGTFTKGTDEGKAASMTTDGKIKVGGADEVLRGVIKAISGTDITVQVRGLAEVSYTGTAPTAGTWNKLECGAGGAIQVDATNGHEFFVETVDTSAGTCVIDLG